MVEEADGDIGLALVVDLVSIDATIVRDEVHPNQQQHHQYQPQVSGNVLMASISRLSGTSLLSAVAAASEPPSHRPSTSSHPPRTTNATSESRGGEPLPLRPGDAAGGGTIGGDAGAASNSSLAVLPSSYSLTLTASIVINSLDGSGPVVVEQVGGRRAGWEWSCGGGTGGWVRQSLVVLLYVFIFFPACSSPLPPHAKAALIRGLSILSKVPLIVTLVDLSSGVLFQNDLSAR